MIRNYIENKKEEIKKLNKNYKLYIITDGIDARCNSYMKSKIKHGTEMGFHVEKIIVNSVKEMSLALCKAKIDGACTICQFPIKEELKNYYLSSKMAEELDVDGFFSERTLYHGILEQAPCTPKGIIKFLESEVKDLNKKNLVIFGRGELTGLPLVNLAIPRFASVSVITSKTDSVHRYNAIQNADIFVLATGVKGSLKLSEIPVHKPVVVMNVGTILDENRKLTTELDLDTEDKDNVYYTPRIGGVGILTVLSLFENIIEKQLTR